LENTNEPPAFVGETLEEKFAQLLMVAELCVQVRATTPALILIYSAIEVAGWLSGQKFTGWVKKYLLPDSNLDCTPGELYGARNGIVHNFSSESDASREGKLRQIVYSWGKADIETLRMMTNIVNLDLDLPNAGARGVKAKFTSVILEDLLAAFRIGLVRFFKEAESNERIAKRIKERSGKVLVHMSRAEGETLVKKWDAALLREIAAIRDQK
jgi:hypothetical protein